MIVRGASGRNAGQHIAQGGSPVLALEPKNGPAPLAVEQGITRSLRWSWVIAAGNRVDLRGLLQKPQFSPQFTNRITGEELPGSRAFQQAIARFNVLLVQPS